MSPCKPCTLCNLMGQCLYTDPWWPNTWDDSRRRAPLGLNVPMDRVRKTPGPSQCQSPSSTWPKWSGTPEVDGSKPSAFTSLHVLQALSQKKIDGTSHRHPLRCMVCKIRTGRLRQHLLHRAGDSEIRGTSLNFKVQFSCAT